MTAISNKNKKHRRPVMDYVAFGCAIMFTILVMWPAMGVRKILELLRTKPEH